MAESHPSPKAVQHISFIKPANAALLRRLSPIAAVDARPDAARQADIDDTVHQLMHLGCDLTNQLTNGFALQSSQPLPTDFSHFEEWYNHFFGTWSEPPTIAYSRTPRVGIKMSASLTDTNLRVLLEVIPDFQGWADDIVAFLVWEECQHLAMSGADGANDIRNLHFDVSCMMDGRTC